MHRETWLAEKVDDLGGSYDPSLYECRSLAETIPRPLSRPGRTHHVRFQADGFLSVRDVLSATDVEDAIAGIDNLISGEVPEFRGIQWEGAAREKLAALTVKERRAYVRKLIYFVDHEPRLQALAYRHDVVSLIGELLGGEPELFADQALLKPPGIGREKPWHQDKAFFDVRPGAPVVAIWIALDDTDPSNGCMHAIPGSHRDGPVIHFNRRDFQICDTDVRRTEVVGVPLPSGGAMLFDGLLHHGTPANSSPRRRWALQFHYARKDDIWGGREERAEYKRRRLEVFGADGKDVTC